MLGQHSMLRVQIFLFAFTYFAASMCSARVLNRYIRHYEPLSYEPVKLHQGQVGRGRWKRSADTHRDIGHPIQVTFKALNILFRLRLVRDQSSFSDDFVLMTNHGAVNTSLDHLYSGHVIGFPSSRVVGALLDGVFVGRISLNSPSGAESEEFHVERASRYLRPPHRGVHSVIYSARDVAPSGGRCGLHGAAQQFLERVQREHRTVGPKPKKHSGQQLRLKRSVLDLTDGNMRHSGGDHSAATDATDSFMTSGTTTSPDHGARDFEERDAIKRQGDTHLKRVCNLEVLVDHTLFEVVLSDLSGEREKAHEAIITMVNTHAAAATDIFNKTYFGSITGISFEVQRVQINDSSACEGPTRHTNPFCRENMDATHVLFELSKINHDNFCVSYVWTNRDFPGGTLGLAYLAEPGADSGGLCDKYHFGANVDLSLAYKGSLSLNTGLVTFINNNVRQSQRDTEVTFAHELGHNFGSPHDFPAECTPGGTEGNYLMYPNARRVAEPNSRTFSSCSIRNITRVLEELIGGDAFSPNCFQEPRGPFCGNKIREEGEECDCGYDSRDCVDRCCYPRESGPDKACKLRPGAKCSPSNSPCCTKNCGFQDESVSCRAEDDCRFEAFCEGVSDRCPDSAWRANGTLCNHGTQLCEAGECLRSVCLKYGLAPCFLSGPDLTPGQRCLIACKGHGADSECHEACHFERMRGLCNKRLEPGAACDNLRGYCDVFQRCRHIDTEGPLTRLQWLVFGHQGITNALTRYWYLTMLGILLSGVLTLLAIRVSTIYTPTSNPQLKPHKKLTVTAIHPLDHIISHIHRHW